LSTTLRTLSPTPSTASPTLACSLTNVAANLFKLEHVRGDGAAPDIERASLALKLEDFVVAGCGLCRQRCGLARRTSIGQSSSLAVFSSTLRTLDTTLESVSASSSPFSSNERTRSSTLRSALL
jgi:hypothetical protein